MNINQKGLGFIAPNLCYQIGFIMNLLDCVVTKVLSEPFEQYEKWWVKVEFDCYGQIRETQIMFKTKEEALEVEFGYVFLG